MCEPALKGGQESTVGLDEIEAANTVSFLPLSGNPDEKR